MVRPDPEDPAPGADDRTRIPGPDDHQRRGQGRSDPGARADRTVDTGPRTDVTAGRLVRIPWVGPGEERPHR
ncbi:hypothetical protein GCM10011608_13710 [Micromonospora sonchi]|uniref:Uncharacterized protein n=1 Tax=Micromonospora sonchi TaxID=1763543 RepID=A0A917TNV4_9ACTN|nr:hypothetical protein GCM10011608_13710 [Micromonospora sonchi]